MKIRSVGGLPFVSIVATVRGDHYRFSDLLSSARRPRTDG
jgi:hypothetical protein